MNELEKRVEKFREELILKELRRLLNDITKKNYTRDHDTYHGLNDLLEFQKRARDILEYWGNDGKTD